MLALAGLYVYIGRASPGVFPGTVSAILEVLQEGALREKQQKLYGTYMKVKQQTELFLKKQKRSYSSRRIANEWTEIENLISITINKEKYISGISEFSIQHSFRVVASKFNGQPLDQDDHVSFTRNFHLKTFWFTNLQISFMQLLNLIHYSILNTHGLAKI